MALEEVPLWRKEGKSGKPAYVLDEKSFYYASSKLKSARVTTSGSNHSVTFQMKPAYGSGRYEIEFPKDVKMSNEFLQKNIGTAVRIMRLHGESSREQDEAAVVAIARAFHHLSQQPDGRFTGHYDALVHANSILYQKT